MDDRKHGARESESDLVRNLASYVRANPQAGDTLDGITQWWLGLPAASTHRVQRALAILQAAGLIEPVRALDGRVRYRRVALDARADAQLDCVIAKSGAQERKR